MSKPQQPELRRYMDKRLYIELNGKRTVTGVLRGYDPFMNIVLDDAAEEPMRNSESGERVDLGMVVIRGNSVVYMEALEKISAPAYTAPQ